MALVPFNAELFGSHPGVGNSDSVRLLGRARRVGAPGGATLETSSCAAKLGLEGGNLHLLEGGLKMGVYDSPIIPRVPHVFQSSEELGNNFKDLIPW